MLGIVIGLLIALTAGQRTILGYEYTDDISHYILPYGIVHMLVLILLGIRLPPTKRNVAGDRIQTAGYLYTLIGFSAALLHVAGRNFELVELMSPLGSALVTSILGWFVGGELSSGKNEEGIPALKSEMSKLAVEIGGFMSNVQRAHTMYIKTIDSAADEYTKLQAAQEKVISSSLGSLKEAENMLRKVNETSLALSSSLEKATNSLSKSFGEDLLKATGQILHNAKEHASALSLAASEAKNASRYLAESRVLIEELERLLNYISSLKETT